MWEPRSTPRLIIAWTRFLKRHPLAVAAVAAGAVLLALYPPVVGAIARGRFVARASERLGRPVTVARGRGGLGRIVLSSIRVPASDPGRSPLLTAESVSVPFSALWGGDGAMEVVGLRVEAQRGGDKDNVGDLIERLERRQTGGSESGGSRASSLARVAVSRGTVDIEDVARGVRVSIKSVEGTVGPGRSVSARLGGISGTLRIGGGVGAVDLGAQSLSVEGAFGSGGSAPGAPSAPAVPEVLVKGGYATPLPSLELTGIEGRVGPDPARPGRVSIDLRGSYGGAREALWTAQGGLAPAGGEGTISLRAERFSLEKIREVLPASVLAPAQATVDAAFTATLDGDAVRFGGQLGVAGLSLHHRAVASAPVEDLAIGLELRGTFFPVRRRVELEMLEGQLRHLVGRISGSLELAPGEFTFADGSKLGVKPKIDLRLQVPRLPCSKLLASMPDALIPRLKGFVLGGFFEADIGTKIDYQNLDALELTGKVAIGGCRVHAVPESMSAQTLANSITHAVEVPKGPGQASWPQDTEVLPFVIGPENPDFVPFDQISPFLVASITTTEDGGFFRHRGWVTSEFKSALRRNLSRGGFRLGASSITMQMVKNVLLSHEKTLSRKLQELFLVWYLEQELPKERILELYFNAIEFGPRIYGIGAATRHYFGKRPSELTPLEAAFFSSILPSPKRRYIQYCHGSLYPPWEKYVRRIMAKVHERGRLGDAEYAAASAQTLVFDRTDALPEKQCLDWVRRITYRREPEPPPDPDSQ